MPDGFSLGMHAQDVGEYKRLDEGVLRSLVKRIANGDAVARTELLRANFRLVIKYAVGRYSYLSPAQRQRLDLLDLVQEGYCRLWEKLDKFDPNKASFSTWATYWLQAAIGRMIDEDSRAVHIPSHVAAQAKQISKARTALLSAGKSTSQKDLQQATGVDDERYEAITRFVLGVNPSLDASINGED
ncbi:MAG TPA: sigma-70 family RNA polymerase sigma factor, partial [Candidatus Saccharimonas sp.]|nr:sigma-70 family RNA polymerase sigma factor [Candidatus Saccharimonas sp.]